MLYFAEISGRKIYTSNNSYVGKLKDLIFLAEDQPIITKLVIETPKKNEILIPASSIKKFQQTIEINNVFSTVALSENELYVTKNLLNQQIIDINGNKVVRVNDVAIQDKPYLLIAGADIGLLGILRWFNIEDVVNKIASRLGKSLRSQFLSWADIQPVELASGRIVLKKEEDKLERIMPEDLADHLEKMNLSNIKHLLSILDQEFAAEVIQNLSISYQQSLFKHFSSDKSAHIIELIDPDEAVDILLALPEEKRSEIIAHLDDEHKTEIEYLLQLSHTPIGGIITSEFFTVNPEDSVRKIINKIKSETKDHSFLRYVYVINNQKQLVGVFNLHELLLQNSDTSAYRFMAQNLVVAHLGTPEEIVTKKMLKYKLDALPIIDEKKHILGIVTWDDITELSTKQIS